MRRFLLVFISFLPLSIFAQLRVHYYAQLNAFPKVSELYPISLYAHVIKEELFPPRNDLYSLYAKTIITPNISALTGLEADGEDAIVHIIVVDDAVVLRARVVGRLKTMVAKCDLYYIIKILLLRNCFMN